MEKVEKFEKLDKVKCDCLEDELSSFGFLFEVLGLQYFSLKQLKDENDAKRPAFVRAIYLLVLSIFLLCVSCFFVYSDREGFSTNVTAKTFLTYAIDNSMNVGMLFVLISSTVQAFFTTKKIKNLYINNRKIVQMIASDYDLRINFKSIHKTVKRYLAIVGLYFLLSHGLILIASASSMQKFLVYVIGTFPMFFLMMSVFKFVFYVEMVNRQIEILTSLIKSIFQEHPLKSLEQLHLHLTSIKYMRLADNVFKKFVSAKKQYNVLYENAGLINESMGLTILILLIVLVITLTSSGYQVFVILVGGKSLDKLPGKINLTGLK
jgi:hypothetical protein